MNQNRKYALIFAATLPFLSLALYAAVIVCSAKPEPLPAPIYSGGELQYFPPGPEFKLTRQVQADSPDTEQKIKLTGGVADESAETTADRQDSSAEAKSSDDDSDGIDKWILSPKARRINRNLGID